MCKAPAHVATEAASPTMHQPAELKLTPTWLENKYVIVLGWQRSGTAAAELAALHGATVLGECTL